MGFHCDFAGISKEDSSILGIRMCLSLILMD